MKRITLVPIHFMSSENEYFIHCEMQEAKIEMIIEKILTFRKER